MLVLELVQEEQMALEGPRDYDQEEGYVQSAHVNHHYHHHDHHTITNHYRLVVDYQTVATLVLQRGTTRI